MNNSLMCPHNILLSDRCPRCVVERRVSYSNRLQNLINLSDYENRLLNYADNLTLYRNNLHTYIELQIRSKIKSDINYLLSIVNNNSYDRNTLNIIRFYNTFLNDINLFEPSTYHIRNNNLRYAENIIRENRSILRERENILNLTENSLFVRGITNNSLISRRINNSIITQRTNNSTIPMITTNILKLNIKDLNNKTTLEIYQQNEEEEEVNCTVCLLPLENNNIVRKLHCNHKFHHKCIDTWFEEKHKCPICRYNVLEYFMV